MEVAAPKSYRHYASSPSSAGPETGQDFADCVNLEKADQLLRSTKQYVKWQALRQNNAGLAADVADAVIRRHVLLERARSGGVIDWDIFDNLTESIKKAEISLYNSRQIAQRQKSSEDIVSSTPKVSSPVAVHRVSATSHPRKNQRIPATPLPKPSVVPVPDISEDVAQPLSGNEILSDDHLLILSMQCNGNMLRDGFLGYGTDNDNVMLPLKEINTALDFQIDVDPEKGVAQGWFIDENRHFSLDIPNKDLMVEGKKAALDTSRVAIGSDDIYVAADELGKWFPVDFEMDFSTLGIQVNPREKLPFQLKMEREQRRAALNRSMGPEGPQLPSVETPYQAFSVPFVDMNVSTRLNNDSDRDNDFNYSLLSKGDLVYMSSELFLSGDQEDGVDNVHISLGKKDPSGELLGPLKATEYALGDVRPGYFPILGNTSIERGISLTNQEINRSIAFDTTTFNGMSQPGWEVEVYQNKNLIDSAVVGNDGRYDFDDIPVYYGNNDFEIIFYGPQGQKEIETKRIVVGNDMLKKGEQTYEISLSQQETDMMDLVDEITDYKEEDGLRLSARYNYGLSENMSLGAGLYSLDIDDERHNYLNFGVKKSIGGIFTEADFVKDTEGGEALQILGQTRLGPLSIRGKQEFFSDFVEENHINSSDPIQSRSELSLSSRIPPGEQRPAIPLTLSLKDTRRADSHETTLSNRLAANFGRTYLSHNLSASFDSDAFESSPEVDGALSMSGYLGPTRLRGRLNYELEPEAEIEDLELSDYWRINNDLSAELRLRQDMNGEKTTEGSFNLNWDQGKFTLSPRVSYDSEGEFEGMVTLNCSIGQEPRRKRLDFSSQHLADSGAVSAFVYHDKNNNHQFDKTDEPLKNVEVEASQARKSVETDENGIAFLTGLTKYRPTDITMNSDSLEDPFQKPTEEGNSIVPRPGRIHQFDFPVVTTGEVDGTVFIETDDGTHKSLPNTSLQLLDADGGVVQEVRSEYDGFYLFMEVPPGTYTVQVHPDESELGPSEKPPFKNIEIDAEGSVVSGMDLVLHQSDKPIPAVEPVASEKPVMTASTAETSLASVTPKSVTAPESSTADFIHPDWHYGVHIRSYRSCEKAAEGIRQLQENHKDLLKEAQFCVRQVDLGPEEGIWYRVVAGAFDHKTQAEALAADIKQHEPYAAVLGVENREAFGVHLASYRSGARAAMDLKELQQQYGDILGETDMFIRRVNLGPQKGVWYRVIAGAFDHQEDAERLKSRFKAQRHYAAAVGFDGGFS